MERGWERGREAGREEGREPVRGREKGSLQNKRLQFFSPKLTTFLNMSASLFRPLFRRAVRNLMEFVWFFLTSCWTAVMSISAPSSTVGVWIAWLWIIEVMSFCASRFIASLMSVALPPASMVAMMSGFFWLKIFWISWGLASGLACGTGTQEKMVSHTWH